MIIRKVLFLFLGLLMILGCADKEIHIRRFGQVAEMNPDKIEKFKALYQAVWPEVMESLEEYHVNNYSVFIKDLEEGKQSLFGYFEYTGRDFDRDMAKMLENPKVREWKDLAGFECLIDQPPGSRDVKWADMEEVFYFDGKIDVIIDESKVRRIGTVIGLRPGMRESYTLLHKNAWPEILDKIYEGNIRNWSIYIHEVNGKNYLYSYFEYVGDDFEADMAMIDGDPATIAWMKFTDEACQLPLPTRKEGEWWAAMEQIF